VSDPTVETPEDPGRKVYNPHRRTSRFRIHAPSALVSALGVAALSGLLALLAFAPPQHWPSLRGGPWVGLLAGWSLFLVPLGVGALLSAGLSRGARTRVTLRRSLFLSLTSAALMTGVLLLWRLGSLVSATLPLVGILLLTFSVGFWFRLIVLDPLLDRRESYALGISLVTPLLGFLGAFALLGSSASLLLLAFLFLLFAWGAAQSVLWVTNRPMAREFGQGSVSLLRPLLAHMSRREAEGQETMERFFESISTQEGLALGVLALYREGRSKVVVLAPSVHPGPFAALGSSDLPTKLADALHAPDELELMVPHSPSTHEQDIPSAAELGKVSRACGELLSRLRPAPDRASPLVSGHPGSLVRAQCLGDGVILLITQAPDPTDDIDYALAEMLRAEAIGAGFKDALVLDAHNSFVERQGDIPFGSPRGFQLLQDARESLRRAREETREGPIRIGYAHKGHFTPEEDGIAAAGLQVLVVEAAGARTAYCLFDANNLLRGLRAPLLAKLKGWVDEGEVLTTDNHVVHEVRGGLNTLGERRGLSALLGDLAETVPRAVDDLAPAHVATGGTRVSPVKVLGPGTTERIMTSLADSLLLFSVYLPTSLLLLLLAGTLLLAWVH
jgi:putative membrane protein